MPRMLITSDCQPLKDYQNYARLLGLNVDEWIEYQDKFGNRIAVWQMLVASNDKLNFFIMRLDGHFEIEKCNY